MIEKIEEKLTRIKKIDANKPRKKVAIIGAGMAGLTAAYELSLLGHEVIIFDAQDRVGGRARTHHFEKKYGDHYHELGAMRFPIHHDHTRHYATKICELKFRTFINHHDDEDGFYYIKNVLTTHKDFQMKLLPELNLPENDLNIIFKGPIKPGKETSHRQLLNLIAYPMSLVIKEILSKKDDLDALLGLGPLTPRIIELDKITLGDYLGSYFKSADTLDLIGAVTGLEVFWKKAVTMFVREDILAIERIKNQKIKHEQEDVIEEIVGGTDLLPKKLREKLESLKVPIFLKHEIFSINNQDSQIQLGIKDAATNVSSLRDFDNVICTIPFPVLRRIELTGISNEKKRAIRNLGYTSSIKVLLLCKRRFWEDGKYNIKGGGSQTDLINRQVYYPSDNVESKQSHIDSPLKNITAQFQVFESKSLKDIKKVESPGVLVGSYCWEGDARKLGAVSEDERAQVVKDAISHMHPEILEEGMVLDHKSMFWDECDWTGAAFAFMNPGDFSNYYLDAIKAEGNLFFAGEHCSLDQGWIQGSIISSLRAVEELISK